MRIATKMAAALISAVMVFTLTAVTGCGPSNEEVIRNALIEELDSYKNLDDEALSDFTSAMGSSGLEEMGISSEDLARSILDGFDYTIEDVTVDQGNNKAVATIVVTAKNFRDLGQQVSSIVKDMTTNSEEFSSMSMDEIKQVYGERIMAEIDNIEPQTSEPVEIDYELKGNVWEPTSGAEQAFVNVFFE